MCPSYSLKYTDDTVADCTVQGIEYFNSEPYVSTVCCDRWADWSLVQTGLRPSSSSPSSSSTEVTIEFERNPLEGTLWIYVIDGEKRVPVREVTWVLSEGDERVAWVGVYAAKPTADEGEAESKELQVNFTGWELDLR
jgi:regulation of enolase protein 1 (concanavalin A-like superfamily)